MKYPNLSKALKATRAEIGKLPKDREQLRIVLMERTEERITRNLVVANQAHKDGDTEGCWMARAIVAESRRFLEKLKSDAPK